MSGTHPWPPQPPAHLSDTERKCWDEIIAAMDDRPDIRLGTHLVLTLRAISEARADYNMFRSSRDAALESGEDQKAVRLDKQVIAREQQITKLLAVLFGRPKTDDTSIPDDEADGPAQFFSAPKEGTP